MIYESKLRRNKKRKTASVPISTPVPDLVIRATSTLLVFIQAGKYTHRKGQKKLAGSAHARKSGHVSDCRKLRASLFTAFGNGGRASLASAFIP